MNKPITLCSTGYVQIPVGTEADKSPIVVSSLTLHLEGVAEGTAPLPSNTDVARFVYHEAINRLMLALADIDKHAGVETKNKELS